MIREPFNTLLNAAVQEPSGDNTQPWRFAVDEDESIISVCVDMARDTSPMNAGQTMARLACGAAIESIVQTAAHNDLKTTVTIHDDPLQVATIRIAGNLEQRMVVPNSILTRHTNRRPYVGGILSEADTEQLQRSVPGKDGINIEWVTTRQDIRGLAQIIGNTDADMFGRPEFSRAFLENVRVDLPADAHAREGLPIGSLGLNSLEQRILPLVPKLPDAAIRAWPFRFGFS